MAWQLEPGGVDTLMAKIRDIGIAPCRICERGALIAESKRACNEAFLIDDNTRSELSVADANVPKSSSRIFRGQDFARWSPEWAGLWMIVLKSSENYIGLGPTRAASTSGLFAETYPSIHRAFVGRIADAPIKRQDQGRYLVGTTVRATIGANSTSRRSCIQRSLGVRNWGFDTDGRLCNNTAYISSYGRPLDSCCGELADKLVVCLANRHAWQR